MGWITGYYAGARGQTPVLWKNASTPVEIGTLGLDPGAALDVNNLGQVVGISNNGSGDDRAFIWSETTGMQSLGLLGVGRQASTATAINDLGHVTGFVVPKPDDGPHQIFYWTPEAGMVGIGKIPSALNRYVMPTGINNHDLIVGHAERDVIRGALAFTWSPAGGMAILPDLSDTSTFTKALGVNNLGEIVGYSGTLNEPRGVLWDSTHGIRDLNSLLDSSALGWTIESAVAINDRGQILAFAYTSRGQLGATVILSPTVPEPGSIVLLAIGLIGCLGVTSLRYASRKRAQSARLC
jgi:probable HAF family extracellular repeat protein